MFTNKKREVINTFVLFLSMSLKHLKLQSRTLNLITMIPVGIVAYGFVGKPFSKQRPCIDKQIPFVKTPLPIVPLVN